MEKNESPSGHPVGDQNQENLNNAGGKTQDVVKYDTYVKTLDEVKRFKERTQELAAKVAEFENEKQRQEEEKLKQQGEYQKVLEQREKELEETRRNNELLQKDINDSIKMQAFVSRLPGQIKRPEYYAHIPLDEIEFDPETRSVNAESLEPVVNQWVANYKDLLNTPRGNKPPGDDPAHSKSLTMEEWKKLPLAEKKKRMKDVKYGS